MALTSHILAKLCRDCLNQINQYIASIERGEETQYIAIASYVSRDKLGRMSN